MSSAANALTAYRRHMLNKQAAEEGGGTLGGIGDYILNNPWALGATVGGLGGAASGLFSDEPGSVLRRGLGGALAGAGLGAGYSWLKDYLARNPQGGQPAFDAKGMELATAGPESLRHPNNWRNQGYNWSNWRDDAGEDPLLESAPDGTVQHAAPTVYPR